MLRGLQTLFDFDIGYVWTLFKSLPNVSRPVCVDIMGVAVLGIAVMGIDVMGIDVMGLDVIPNTATLYSGTRSPNP